MLLVRLDEALQSRLDALAKATQRPKSFFVKEALKNYLDDMQDYYEAQKRCFSAASITSYASIDFMHW